MMKDTGEMIFSYRFAQLLVLVICECITSHGYIISVRCNFII